MDYENSLQTSFWTMIFVQTIGSIDMPGRGPRKMPAPRQYVAILVTWLVLQLVSSISANAARATAAIGWILVLVGLVVGSFGKQVIELFSAVGSQFTDRFVPSGSPSQQDVSGAVATADQNFKARFQKGQP